MELIKILRDKTGAGIVDCKKALEDAGVDIDKAVEILRKKGIARAAKRSEREAREGIIKVWAGGKEGGIVEINCETDFVARSDKFQDFAGRVLELIKVKRPKDSQELLSLAFDKSTVKENLDNLSGVIGEKLDIKRCDILSSAGTVAAYCHPGGKIGVLVSLDKPGQEELAYDLAMQIAAANPRYIFSEEVPAEEIAREKEIYAEQLRKEGKPDGVIDKAVLGKINKYFEEVCLINQEFIKDDTKSVADILGEVIVEKFIRYSL